MKRTRIQRIQRILSGGDNRSPSEASASIRSIRVRKKLGGETNTDCTDITDFIRDGVLSEKEFQHTLFVTP